MSWFCNNICSVQGQGQNQLILFNNQTQQIFNYTQNNKKNNPFDRTQLKDKTGFILVKKSLYENQINTCINQNIKFIDKHFPPSQYSLGQNMNLPINSNKKIIWKRISQLNQNNQLIKDKIQPSDIQQGNSGDCYFLAAISALAENQYNILRIFGYKDLKDMNKNTYGIYKVLMNIGGQPQQVIIDDYIPVYQKTLRPVFCKPVNGQFWVVLLQKAWAKVSGSYENISAGNPHQVLNKFSIAPAFYYNIFQSYYQNGQRVNTIEVHQFQQKIWQKLVQGTKFNFAMCCSSRNIVYNNQIKENHSYTVLSAHEITFRKGIQRILKIRNPWGNTQYTGSFSQTDPIWNQINPSIKKSLFEKQQNDGIFLLPYSNFLINFDSINISHCRQNYNYIFKSFYINKSKPKYFQLFIEQDGQIYITFEQNCQKDHYQDKYIKNGVSKVLLAKQIQKQINGYIKKQYQFIDCAIQTVMADVTVRCKNLLRGYYIIMIQNQQNDLEIHNKISYSLNNEKKATISTYSATNCMLNEILQPKNFLFSYFDNHAIFYNHQKKKIGEYQKDYIARKLISEAGYGYIKISLCQKGNKKVQIILNKRMIQESGFFLVLPQNLRINQEKSNKQILTLIVYPGDQLILLFKIDFKRSGQIRLVFPPAGFQVKKII